MRRPLSFASALKGIGRFSSRRPWLVLGMAGVVTVILGLAASTLKIETTWLDLVPQKHPATREFYRVTEEFGAATNILLAIEGNNPQKLKAIAREVAETLSDQTQFFEHVYYRMDRDFFLSHSLMLEKERHLKRMRATLRSFDLVPFLRAANDDFERAYIGGEESLEQNENRVIQAINSYVDILLGIERGLVSNDPTSAAMETARIYVDDASYFFSNDKKMLLVMIQPTCTVNEIDKIGIMVPALRAEVAKFKEKYPQTRFRLTGLHVVFQDEMEASSSDSMTLTNIAFLIVLAGFVIAFRMWTAPLLAMVSLGLGIVWDLGITALAIGRLNIATAMGAAILIGLGVDYFIHILSGHSEGRRKGLSAEESNVYAMEKVGTGVFVGALTTAIALLALTFVQMEFFKELGLVLGVGILTTLLASLFVLPACLTIISSQRKKKFVPALRILLFILAVATVLPGLLMLIDWVNRKIFRGEASGGHSKFFGLWGRVIQRHPARIMLFFFIIIAFVGFFIQYNWFDQNMMNLEMKGLESVKLHREIIRRYGLSDGALFYTTDTIEEAQNLHSLFDDNVFVGAVDSIAGYLPSIDEQKKRLPYLREINKAIEDYRPGSSVDQEELEEEISRFVLNLRELSELALIGGNRRLESRIESILREDEAAKTFGAVQEAVLAAPGERIRAYQQGFGQAMKGYMVTMSSPVFVSLSDIPQDILERSISNDGKRYLGSVFSETDIWENITHSPFIESVQKLAPNATGFPLLFKILIEQGAHYGRIAIIISLGLIFLILLIDLKSLKFSFIALSPLALGSVLMLGIIGILRHPFNIVMIVMLPMIIGIGVDYGVHLLHRYRIEGGDFPKILSSVGKALFLTTFTTMVAFGSLMFAKWQGFVGMGLLLFVGIGACYLVTITFIPSLLRIMDKRRGGAKGIKA